MSDGINVQCDCTATHPAAPQLESSLGCGSFSTTSLAKFRLSYVVDVPSDAARRRRGRRHVVN